MFTMRTTLNLDDEVLEVVTRYARLRSISLGQAVSRLVRLGLDSKKPTRIVNGIRVFDLPKNSPRICSSRVRSLEHKG
jgi:hypothetical protein